MPRILMSIDTTFGSHRLGSRAIVVTSTGSAALTISSPVGIRPLGSFFGKASPFAELPFVVCCVMVVLLLLMLRWMRARRLLVRNEQHIVAGVARRQEPRERALMLP